MNKERNTYYRFGRQWRALREIKIGDGTTQIVRRKKGELTRILTKEKLRELYLEQNKSLEDIAIEFGCSRAHISKIMKKHGLLTDTIQSKN